MKNKHRVEAFFRALQHFLVFFLLAAFFITCCMLLFLSILSRSMQVEFTQQDIQMAAKLTFANVVLLSLIFSVIDLLRRKLSVERPIRKITAAAEKIMQGDFSVRIAPETTILGAELFAPVIDCFNRMAQELSGIETLRTDFVANVSHELKTPLAVMQNYGTLLQQPDLPEQQRQEYAKTITDAGRRLAHLITNILKLNKLENQQIFPSFTQFDLTEQLCACVLQFEDRWEEKNICIETALAPDVTVSADAELLCLVWNNLLSNAFKFTPTGGTVGITLTADDVNAVVTVTDTGCGMSPDIGAHIFEKFYQGDTSHAAEGNGLGLALVKRVVDILHGEIHVESALGQGSTFTVKIRRN
ncbi:MAG: HAMP domain-containing histidine kinase [Oscillospiraceae bacterium]|nr:HAMP domain-containing histidine kinase [Oscillospiraceae bacterium]